MYQVILQHCVQKHNIVAELPNMTHKNYQPRSTLPSIILYGTTFIHWSSTEVLELLLQH